MRDRLYRSRDERILGGVAGGVADWLDVDPSLVRLVWILLGLAWGTGFFLYLVLWFVIPEEPDVYAPPSYATGTTPAGMPPATDPVTGQPIAPPPASSWEAARAERHAARAARRAARAERDGRGAMIFGIILVVIGGWFLARNYIPSLAVDLTGPVALIIIGVLVMALAIRRNETPR